MLIERLCVWGRMGFPPVGWVERAQISILGIPFALWGHGVDFCPGGLPQVRRGKVVMRWVHGILLMEGIRVFLRCPGPPALGNRSYKLNNL